MCTLLLAIVVLVNIYFPQVKGASIVNGFSKPIEPNLGAFPFHVSLMQRGKNGVGYFSFCGGSLIHPRWVLTAAHCIQLDENTDPIKPKDTFISLGTIYRSGKGGQTIQAESVKIHPNYLKSGGRADLGVVKLKTNANVGTNIKMIKLHTNNGENLIGKTAFLTGFGIINGTNIKMIKLHTNNGENLIGKTAFLTGFGIINGTNIKMIKLHTNNGENLIGKTAFLTGFGIINDFYDTPQRLRKAVLHISNYDKCFSERAFGNVEICAASTVAEGKACKGDSGGPLFVVKNGKYIQVGITSHLAILPFCRISINNSVYTRVSAYIAWISRATGIDFMKYNPGG